MPAAPITSREAAHQIYVCTRESVLEQALADTETITVEPCTRTARDVDPGAYVRVGTGLIWFARTEGARSVWRAVLEARGAEGRVVTEAEKGEEPEAFRDRHVAALVAAGRIAP